MTRRSRNILIFLSAITFLVLGGFYFSYRLLRSFAPPEITITPAEIKSSLGFINPITIEKLTVDSLGEEKRPVKYVITYISTCSIKQIDGKPPVSLKKIKFHETGRYSWSEEKVNIPITHEDGYSKRVDSVQTMKWSMGTKNFETCPFKFESGNWYFINVIDPRIVGIYVYIDRKGDIHQYTSYTGVSPI